MKTILFIFGLYYLSFQASFAQQYDIKELLSKVHYTYKAKSQYYIEADYKMLRGREGNMVTESYPAVSKKQNGITSFEALGNLQIIYPKVKLTISKENQQILLSENNQKLDGNSPVDVDLFLKYFGDASIKELNKYFECTLLPTTRHTQIPYNKVILTIHKENFTIAKQELFFSTMVPFKNRTSGEVIMDTGRLQIMLNHITNKKIDSILPLQHYLHKQRDQYQLTSDYQSYTLINQLP
ncbi:hypothetical protein NBT05_17250 [Aquimarina sp. ERC-38]|uniref:hypothetical protein n=1 Tax=Aquimarina sp. ERC-38 TaxID=2949996 RepID=UPI00224506DD|nr:hypothetical protein [Aquimarina sp. ERC-38]UZO80675.1 hypothetical protein NBT05_17250 [Aquimarina sp. ERC-38]